MKIHKTSRQYRLWGSLWYSLWDSLWSSLRGSLRDSLWHSLWDSLWDSLRDSLVQPAQAAASKRPAQAYQTFTKFTLK
jgi:hypothetical protein